MRSITLSLLLALGAALPALATGQDWNVYLVDRAAAWYDEDSASAAGEEEELFRWMLAAYGESGPDWSPSRASFTPYGGAAFAADGAAYQGWRYFEVSDEDGSRVRVVLARRVPTRAEPEDAVSYQGIFGMASAGPAPIPAARHAEAVALEGRDLDWLRERLRVHVSGEVRRRATSNFHLDHGSRSPEAHVQVLLDHLLRRLATGEVNGEPIDEFAMEAAAGMFLEQLEGLLGSDERLPGSVLTTATMALDRMPLSTRDGSDLGELGAAVVAYSVNGEVLDLLARQDSPDRLARRARWMEKQLRWNGRALDRIDDEPAYAEERTFDSLLTKRLTSQALRLGEARP